MTESEDWADAMTDGEDYDETLGAVAAEREPTGVDDARDIDATDAPDGYEDRDEEWAEDDPADVPDEHGGQQWSADTDDDGVDDTVMPEGTDSIIDENDDWE